MALMHRARAQPHQQENLGLQQPGMQEVLLGKEQLMVAHGLCFTISPDVSQPSIVSFPTSLSMCWQSVAEQLNLLF